MLCSLTSMNEPTTTTTTTILEKTRLKLRSWFSSLTQLPPLPHPKDALSRIQSSGEGTPAVGALCRCRELVALAN